jgi:hypothetical protein
VDTSRLGQRVRRLDRSDTSARARPAQLTDEAVPALRVVEPSMESNTAKARLGPRARGCGGR